MKFCVNREALADALAFASEIVKVKTPKPALTAVKLKAEGKMLSLVATDMEIAMRWNIAAVDIADEGEALIPATRLTDVVGSVNDSTLTFETEGDACFVKSANSKFKLFGYLPSELPPVDAFTPKDSDLIVAGPELLNMLEQTEYAVAKEATRYAINGTLFERKDQWLSLVGTNCHMLAKCRSDGQKGEDFAHVVTRKVVSLLKMLLDSPDAMVRMQFTPSASIFAVFTSEPNDPPMMLRGSLVEGTYPSYDAILPKDCDKKVSIVRQSLIGAIQQARLMTNEESKGIRMAFTRELCQISARAPAVGEATVDVHCEYDGEPMEIGFNPQYVLDLLKPMECERVTIEFKSPNKPAKFTGDAGCLAIVMPVNLT